MILKGFANLCRMEYKSDLEYGKELFPLTEKPFKKLKSKKGKLDDSFHKEHDKVFNEIDCLNCANCCKTTSPIFRAPDIKRLAKFQKRSEQAFTDEYLHKDGDGDMVLNSAPCPFLNEDDNTCFVYEHRPWLAGNTRILTEKTCIKSLI